MRDYYFCLAGGAIQPVKARDLATAAEFMRHRGDVLAVYTGPGWQRNAAAIQNDGADMPQVLPVSVARSREYEGVYARG